MSTALCSLYNLFGQIIIMFLFVWQVEPIPSKPPRSFASPTTATTGKAIETVIIIWNVDIKIFTFMWFEKRSMINDQLTFCRTRQLFKFEERFSELIKKKLFKMCPNQLSLGTSIRLYLFL